MWLAILAGVAGLLLGTTMNGNKENDRLQGEIDDQADTIADLEDQIDEFEDAEASTPTPEPVTPTNDTDPQTWQTIADAHENFIAREEGRNPTPTPPPITPDPINVGPLAEEGGTDNDPTTSEDHETVVATENSNRGRGRQQTENPTLT